MDLPLGPDPISNDISKTLPICFNRNWIGFLPLVLLHIRGREVTMIAFFSWDYCVYLDQKLTDVNLTKSNAEKIINRTPKCSISLRRAFFSHHMSQRTLLLFSYTAQPWGCSSCSTLRHMCFWEVHPCNRQQWKTTYWKQGWTEQTGQALLLEKFTSWPTIFECIKLKERELKEKKFTKPL